MEVYGALGICPRVVLAVEMNVKAQVLQFYIFVYLCIYVKVSIHLFNLGCVKVTKLQVCIQWLHRRIIG